MLNRRGAATSLEALRVTFMDAPVVFLQDSIPRSALSIPVVRYPGLPEISGPMRPAQVSGRQAYFPAFESRSGIIDAGSSKDRLSHFSFPISCAHGRIDVDSQDVVFRHSVRRNLSG